jgi:hypothetical protein
MQNKLITIAQVPITTDALDNSIENDNLKWILKNHLCPEIPSMKIKNKVKKKKSLIISNHELMMFWTNNYNLQNKCETGAIGSFKLISKKCDNRQKLGEIRTTETHFIPNNLITEKVLHESTESISPESFNWWNSNENLQKISMITVGEKD